MSFRGRGGGGGRGGGFRGGRGGRGGGRGGFQQDFGPPDRVVEMGHFVQPCEDDLVCKVTLTDVPYFNAPVYLENKEQIGKVDEIFGPIRDYYVSVKLSPNMKASSFEKLTKFFIDPMKILPLARFISGDKPRGRGRGGPRGGRGGRGGGFRGGGGRGGGGFRGGGGRGGGGFRGRGGGGFSRGGGRGGSRGGFNKSF